MAWEATMPKKPEASRVICPGCRRTITIPQGFSGDEFLCAACHYPQTMPLKEVRGIPGAWFRAGCVLGIGLVGLTGFTLCILYLAGTGRKTWFALLLLVMVAMITLPLSVYRRRRHLLALIPALYLPLGLWCYLWYLAPGVGWGYAPSLLGGGIFFLVLGSGALYLYRRDMRSLPRW